MLLFTLFAFCSANLVPVITDLEGPRDTYPSGRKTTAENTINIEFRDGNYYNPKNASTVAHQTRDKIVVGYQIHTSYTMLLLLSVSTVIQILTMVMSFMLFLRKPRYIPSGGEMRCVHIHHTEKTDEENMQLASSIDSFHCNRQEYV